MELWATKIGRTQNLAWLRLINLFPVRSAIQKFV